MFLGWIILIAVGTVLSIVFIGGLLFKLYKKIKSSKREFLLTSHHASAAASPELPRLPSIGTLEGKKKLEKSKSVQSNLDLQGTPSYNRLLVDTLIKIKVD
jgi:hypothetical protein